MTDDLNGKLRSRKMFLLRNTVFLLGVLFAVWVGQFAYRNNNICSPGEHILQSDTDAIEVAKNRLVKDPFFSSEEFGGALEFLDALHQTNNCCEVIRRRTFFFVIVWDVFLVAETPTKRLSALMGLSNCGTIFAETKFKAIEPANEYAVGIKAFVSPSKSEWSVVNVSLKH